MKPALFRARTFPAIGLLPLGHASLDGVRGIPFLGCTYAGTIYGNPADASLRNAGTGVNAVNSSFIVGSKCTVVVPYGTPCPPANLYKTTFAGLAQGVQATSLDPGKTFSVDEATFTNCPRGIRMEGVSNAAITRNNFAVNDFTGSYYQFSVPYGAYSDQCTGYKIENNVFTSNHPHTPHTGLVIKDSGPNSNTVYNNRFDGFYEQNSTALLIQGNNAAPNGQLTGLEVRCNEFGQHGADNRFDVALTGSNPTVKVNQGRVFTFPTDFAAPAGNLFSLQGQPESDWHVGASSNTVNYYHHSGNGSWYPTNVNPLLFRIDANGAWPTSRSQACPDHFQSGVVELQQLQAEAVQQDVQLQADRQAYDATKDNGDTYSLLSYVENPANSDVQVRNALQSIAPKVSAEVWEAAFARQPAMDDWYLTQALLANSPLQPEVMDLCYKSTLGDFYYNLVAEAQNGTNILSILESGISGHAGARAIATTELGRRSWLDSTAVDSAITGLTAWQDNLLVENSSEVRAGYYMAKDLPGALQTLAEEQIAADHLPELHQVWKRWAMAEQQQGWAAADSNTVDWLRQLAEDRWTIGSAQAGAWLQALGEAPLDEVIILPADGLKRLPGQRPRRPQSETWMLQAWPNPSVGPVHIVCNVPPTVSKGCLRILDLNGRLVKEEFLAPGAGIVELLPGIAAPGLYMAELHLDGIQAGRVKLALQ